MVLIIPPIPILGIISQRAGNRIISGNSHAKFVDQKVAESAYEDVKQALGAGMGSDYTTGKPHYYFTFNIINIYFNKLVV